MKVLQFAFGADLPSSPNIPHNFSNTNSFVYTGTHDNNTVRGWYDAETDNDTRLRISEYFGFQVDDSNIETAMLNLAYSAAVDTVIVPLQDVLGLGGNSNTFRNGRGKLGVETGATIALGRNSTESFKNGRKDRQSLMVKYSNFLNLFLTSNVFIMNIKL